MSRSEYFVYFNESDPQVDAALKEAKLRPIHVLTHGSDHWFAIVNGQAFTWFSGDRENAREVPSEEVPWGAISIERKT
jgi:hypothetical protein